MPDRQDGCTQMFTGGAIHGEARGIHHPIENSAPLPLPKMVKSGANAQQNLNICLLSPKKEKILSTRGKRYYSEAFRQLETVEALIFGAAILQAVYLNQSAILRLFVHRMNEILNPPKMWRLAGTDLLPLQITSQTSYLIWFDFGTLAQK